MGRKLGQHFLTDPAILDRIVDCLDPQPDDLVLEIGPGRGTLTRRLVGRVDFVVAVEKDGELVELLCEECRVQSAECRASVVRADALRIDWGGLLAEQTPHLVPNTRHAPFKVIGNIPYYITSPLIDKALTPPLPERIVFLVQKEVAERLGADPGGKTYGALTVGVRALADVERLFTVKRGAFNPPPAVDSAVVRLTPRKEPLVTPEELPRFRGFVQALFSRRRKQIAGIVRAVASLDLDRARAALARADVDPTARPETLAPETIVRLFRAVSGNAG